MKMKRSLISAVVATVLAVPAFTASAVEKLALYNWSIYINPEILTDFTKETGIAVTLDNYGTNEEMLAKLQAGAKGYDIVFPSVYMQDIMSKLGLLQPIGLQAMRGRENVDPKYFKAISDPKGDVCMPYNWGSTGLLVNKAMTKGMDVGSWKMIFEPPEALRGKIAVLDDVRETLGAALIYNGFQWNSVDPKELAAARDTILKAKPYWAAMLTDGIGDKVINGDFAVAHWWSGSAAQSVDTAKDRVEYVLPKEGVNGFQEQLCVLKSAPNTKSAKAFVQYMLQPKVAAKNANWLRGGTPNTAAMELLDPALKSNKALYPNEKAFKQFSTTRDLGDKTALWDKVWTAIKAR